MISFLCKEILPFNCWLINQKRQAGIFPAKQIKSLMKSTFSSTPSIILLEVGSKTRQTAPPMTMRLPIFSRDDTG